MKRKCRIKPQKYYKRSFKYLRIVVNTYKDINKSVKFELCWIVIKKRISWKSFNFC